MGEYPVRELITLGKTKSATPQMELEKLANELGVTLNFIRVWA